MSRVVAVVVVIAAAVVVVKTEESVKQLKESLLFHITCTIIKCANITLTHTKHPQFQLNTPAHQYLLNWICHSP